MNNRYICALFAVLLSVPAAWGQNALDQYRKMQSERLEQMRRQKSQAFDGYRRQRQTAFERYRKQCNEAFANYIARKWVQMQVYRGLTPPPSPDPVRPVLAPDKPDGRPPVTLPIKGVTPLPKPQPRVPLTVMPDTPAPLPSVPGHDFKDDLPGGQLLPTEALFQSDFYGTSVRLRLKPQHKVALDGVDEQSVSSYWRVLSDGRLDEVVDDCVAWREALNLSDYAYVMLLDRVCTDFWGSVRCNESVLLQTFLLAQSGYDVKMARTGNDLVLLLSIDGVVYNLSYLSEGGKKYYLLNAPEGGNGYYTFGQQFSEQSQPCSMMMRGGIELFADEATPVRRLSSRRYPELSVEVQLNKHLIDLYADYPQSTWDVYAAAGPSNGLAEELYPVLEQAIAGKPVAEAANMLINFVQTSFEYMTDGDQFGRERPLFVDETCYYPYSDCEDRAIFYAHLVRTLLHLDVVLLHYPGHLATAVRFPDGSVDGDRVLVDGQTYIVCDPTYIGADIGMAMEQYKTVQAEVVKF